MLPRALHVVAALAFAIFAAPGATTGQDKPAGDFALPEGVVGRTWQWIWYGDGKEEFDVDKPEQYTIAFSADGHVAIQADCNRGRSDFVLGPDYRITLSPIALTMMMCPDGSLDGRFVAALERVATFFDLDGDFLLEAPMDSGTLRFRATDQ